MDLMDSNQPELFRVQNFLLIFYHIALRLHVQVNDRLLDAATPVESRFRTLCDALQAQVKTYSNREERARLRACALVRSPFSFLPAKKFARSHWPMKPTIRHLIGGAVPFLSVFLHYDQNTTLRHGKENSSFKTPLEFIKLLIKPGFKYPNISSKRCALL